MAQGYKTSASCSLTFLNGGRSSSVRGELVDISVDGAQIRSEQPISVGTSVQLSLDKFAMSAIAAQVVENHGDAGGGYRMDLRITKGSWPYQVFVSLTTFAITSDKTSGSTIPPCLEELGLRLPCTADEVRASFQKRVRHAHPDRGGDVESFVRLRAAYHEALALLGAKR
ncbi:MAG: PilZ domain-containing protein [Planctomycetota bacterium]